MAIIILVVISMAIIIIIVTIMTIIIIIAILMTTNIIIVLIVTINNVCLKNGGRAVKFFLAELSFLNSNVICCYDIVILYSL